VVALAAAGFCCGAISRGYLSWCMLLMLISWSHFRLTGFIQLKKEDREMLIDKLGKGEKK